MAAWEKQYGRHAGCYAHAASHTRRKAGSGMEKGSTGTASGPVKKRARRGLFSAAFSGLCIQHVSGRPWKGGWHADIKGTEKHDGNCATKTKNADSAGTPVNREADRRKENRGKRRDSGLQERLCCLPCGQGRNCIPHPCMQRVLL